MRRILLFAILILWAGSAWGATETFYICHGGDGSAPTSQSCSTAWDETDFNTSGNWGTGAGKIDGSDIVYLLDDGGDLGRLECQGNGDNITITPYFGESVVINGAGNSGEAFDFNCKSGITLDGDNRLTITNPYVDAGNSGRHGIYTGSCADTDMGLAIKNLIIEGCGVDSSLTSRSANASHGIRLEKVTGVDILGVTIRYVADDGIYGSCDECLIDGNTISYTNALNDHDNGDCVHLTHETTDGAPNSCCTSLQTEADQYTGWTSVSGPTLESSEAQAQDGSSSLLFTSLGSADRVYCSATTVVGQLYNVSAYYDVVNGDADTGLTIRLGTSEDDFTYDADINNIESDWTQYSKTFTATTTTVYLTFREEGAGNDVQAYIDSVTIYAETGHGDTTISDNFCDHTNHDYKCCFILTDSTTPSQNTIIHGNTCLSGGAEGIKINCGSGTGNKITSNYIFGDGSADQGAIMPWSDGIFVANNKINAMDIAFDFTNGPGTGVSAVDIYNNTAYNIRYGVKEAASASQAGDLELKNNTFYLKSGTSYFWYLADGDTTLTADYNDLFANSGDHADLYYYVTDTDCDDEDIDSLADWQSCSGADANSTSSDPLFESATDFHLQPGSPCIGAGTPIAGIYTDYDGWQRRYPESIGAYADHSRYKGYNNINFRIPGNPARGAVVDNSLITVDD